MRFSLGKRVLTVSTLSWVALAGARCSRPARHVYAELPASYGARVSTPVSYRGLEVGRVAAVTSVAGGGVRLGLELRRADLPLRAGDTLRFLTRGIEGERVIDIRPGSLGEPLVPEGGTLRVGPSPVDVDSAVRLELAKHALRLDSLRAAGAGTSTPRP